MNTASGRSCLLGSEGYSSTKDDYNHVELQRGDSSVTERRSVLERAARVLSSFDQSNRFQSLSAISRSASLPLTTTHRIITELLALGLLDRDDSGLLSVGTELWKIGLCAPKAYGLQRIALPFMQDMYAATGFPIHLGVCEGSQVLFVESLRKDRSTNERPRLGEKYPLHITAVGMALLAHMPESFLVDYLDHANAAKIAERGPAASTHQALPAEPDVRKALARVRSEGFSVSERQADPNAVALGAPILVGNGPAVGAISIIVPIGIEYRPYALLVRATARSIQRSLSEPI